MGVSTVERASREPKSRKAKEPSGFSIRSWLFPAADRDEEPTGPEPFAPDAQSRWVLEHFKGELSKAVDYLVKKQQKPAAAASPTDLDGSHPAYLLRRLAMLALDLEIDPKVTFAEAVSRLQWAWDMLNERAEEQAAFERHSPVNAVEAAADGALLAASTRRRKQQGGSESDRAQVVAAEIVDRAAKAPFPTELQVRMTPEVVARIDAGESPEAIEAEAARPLEVTAVMPAVDASPVHTGHDEIAPPVPDAEQVADPGAHKPLPRRSARVTTFPARLDEHGAVRDGKEVDALDVPGTPDGTHFLLHLGAWCLIEGADVVGEQVCIRLATNVTDCPHFTARVRVLSETDAKALWAAEVSR